LIVLLPVFFIMLLGACESDMSPETRLDKLRRLVEDRDFEEALEQVKILKKDMSTDSVFLMLAGKTYLGLEQIDSAHVCFKQYTALHPLQLQGYHFLYQTGEILQDYDAQIWAVSQLGYLENNRRKYHYDIARLNFLRGEYGQAMKTCYMILEYDPGNPDVLFILANSLAAADKVDSAIVIMEKLNRQNPDKVEVLTNLASFLVENKEYEKAEVHFRRLTTVFPDYVPGWYGLGNALLSKGDTANAKKAYLEVYSRDQDFLQVDSIIRSLDPLLPK